MRKIFIFPILLFVLCMVIIYLNTHTLNVYNTEFFHPLFSSLLPLTLLLFLSSFLKNIKPKVVFLTILIFGIIDLVLLSQIDTTCSQILCFDRNLAALVISSIFSIVYFVVLLLQNRKKSI